MGICGICCSLPRVWPCIWMGSCQMPPTVPARTASEAAPTALFAFTHACVCGSGNMRLGHWRVLICCRGPAGWAMLCSSTHLPQSKTTAAAAIECRAYPYPLFHPHKKPRHSTGSEPRHGARSRHHTSTRKLEVAAANPTVARRPPPTGRVPPTATTIVARLPWAAQHPPSSQSSGHRARVRWRGT